MNIEKINKVFKSYRKIYTALSEDIAGIFCPRLKQVIVNTRAGENARLVWKA